MLSKIGHFPAPARTGAGAPAGSKYLISGLILLAIYFVPWKELLSLSLRDDQYTHILVAPFLAGALIYLDKHTIFRKLRYSPLPGISMAALGMGLCNIAAVAPAFRGSAYYLSVSTLGGVVILAAGFLAWFGPGALRRAAFPVGLLLMMVPIPEPVMTPVVRGLQDGSAAFSAVLFKLLHVPALKQDLRFSLPGLDIEIAEQCSGVRSSIALCLASALAGHLFLRTWWKKASLVLITIPLVMFKNAVRIVTISSLGVYVSRGFLAGPLHRYGGLPFSLLDLAILTPILVSWHRSDARTLQGNTTVILPANAKV